MAHGGKRAGAGKPKGRKAPHTLDAAAGKARMIELINKRVDDLISWLFQKAYEIDEQGKTKIDVMAVKELLDRGYGKAAQAVDVTTKGEQINTSSPMVIALAKEYEEKIKKGL